MSPKLPSARGNYKHITKSSVVELFYCISTERLSTQPHGFVWGAVKHPYDIVIASPEISTAVMGQRSSASGRNAVWVQSLLSLNGYSDGFCTGRSEYPFQYLKCSLVGIKFTEAELILGKQTVKPRESGTSSKIRFPLGWLIDRDPLLSCPGMMWTSSGSNFTMLSRRVTSFSSSATVWLMSTVMGFEKDHQVPCCGMSGPL